MFCVRVCPAHVWQGMCVCWMSIDCCWRLMQRGLNHFVWMLVTLQQYFNRTCKRDLALNSGIQTTACCCSYHEGYTHIFSKATCPIHVIFGSAVRVYMFDYPWVGSSACGHAWNWIASTERQGTLGFVIQGSCPKRNRSVKAAWSARGSQLALWHHSCHVMLCSVMSCHVMSCHVCHVMLCWRHEPPPAQDATAAAAGRVWRPEQPASRCFASTSSVGVLHLHSGFCQAAHASVGSCHVMSCRVMSCHVMLCYVMPESLSQQLTNNDRTNI